MKPASSIAELNTLGVGISYQNAPQLHVGILYSTSGSEARFCHLAFHHLLKDDLASDIGDLYWESSGLDISNSRAVAAYVKNMHQNKSSIPYGFDADGNCFDPKTGAFLEQPIGKGLSCSTFVLAIFKTLGFNLLDLSTWPDRDEDLAWQQGMIEQVERYSKKNQLDSDLHIEMLRNDVGAKRLRPEEAAAGVTADQEHAPLEFVRARELADAIIESIIAAKKIITENSDSVGS